MSNPNIAAARSILGGTVYGALVNTSLTEVLENASSSDAIIKVNSIVIINIDAADSANITVTLSDASGGSDVTIAAAIGVPAKSNLVLCSSDTRFYLLENKAINLQASAANDLNYLISYETIS
jgi:hypothetical protein|tara:strand:- start:1460 stop:1828 length:369 start_codon:yes stop_codon:yes gene_type:complete